MAIPSTDFPFLILNKYTLVTLGLTNVCNDDFKMSYFFRKELCQGDAHHYDLKYLSAFAQWILQGSINSISRGSQLEAGRLENHHVVVNM